MAVEYKRNVKKAPQYYNKTGEIKVILKLQNLIEYIYVLINKFPRGEIFNLTSDIKNNIFECLEALVFAKNVIDKKLKVKYIMVAEAKLNILNVLVRIARKNSYIKPKNYSVWSYKITEISDMLVKWRSACLK